MARLFLIALFSLFLVNCSEPNYLYYGVSKSDPQLVFSNSYNEKGKYQTQSTLLDSPRIEVVHLGTYSVEDFSLLKSTVRFWGFMDTAKYEIIEVSIENRDLNNNILSHIKNKSLDLPLKSPSESRPEISRIYRRSEMPDRIIQTINILIKDGNKTKPIYYEFRLHKTSKGGWDAVMGI
ncbi:MAG: hypothetical protein AAF555_11640 [Verrucomicrobiota bacterium]